MNEPLPEEGFIWTARESELYANPQYWAWMLARALINRILAKGGYHETV